MAAMSRETRRIVVAHLTSRSMSPAVIASELGVSRDTVRRDLAEAPPRAAAAESEPAAAPAPGLLLPESTQLGKDLRLLAASYKAPAEDVARALIYEAAQAVRRTIAARFAAASGPDPDRSGSPVRPDHERRLPARAQTHGRRPEESGSVSGPESATTGGGRRD